MELAQEERIDVQIKSSSLYQMNLIYLFQELKPFRLDTAMLHRNQFLSSTNRLNEFFTASYTSFIS